MRCNICSQLDMPEAREPKAKSLYKALQLLDFFDDAHPERGVSELALLSGELKSTVHNILQTFELCGFVQKSKNSGGYRLGEKILQIGNIYYKSNPAYQNIKLEMQAISDRTGETLYFVTISDLDAIYIESAYPSRSVPAARIMGFKAPLYCTGIGKAILAFQDESIVRRVIDRGLTAFTQQTITEGDCLREELGRIRKQGYAVDNMEHEYGIRCVAVPLIGPGGNCRYAVSVSGPSLRMTDAKIIEYAGSLRQLAAKYARNL